MCQTRQVLNLSARCGDTIMHFMISPTLLLVVADLASSLPPISSYSVIWHSLEFCVYWLHFHFRVFAPPPKPICYSVVVSMLTEHVLKIPSPLPLVVEGTFLLDIFIIFNNFLTEKREKIEFSIFSLLNSSCSYVVTARFLPLGVIPAAVSMTMLHRLHSQSNKEEIEILHKGC